MLKPGTLLLSCEPFVYAAELNISTDVCDNCLKTASVIGRDLRRCLGCGLVFYCDQRCQKRGWKDGHKYECKSIRMLNFERPYIPDLLERSLLRVIVKQSKGVEHYDVVKTDKGEIKRTFGDLISHVEEIKKSGDYIQKIEKGIFLVKFFLKHFPDINIPSDDELWEISGRININAIQITSDIALGAGVYLAGSIFNHSCDEMADRSFVGPTLFVRNIKEIPADMTLDKVTISYKDSLRPRKLRREVLQRHYFFTCECEKCSTGLHDFEMTKVPCISKGCNAFVDAENINIPCKKCGLQFNKEQLADISALRHLLISPGNRSGSEDAEMYIKKLTKMGFPETHWMMINLYGEAFRAYYNEVNFSKAYFYGTKYIEGARLYLNPNNNNIGRYLAKVAQLALLLNKLEEADMYVEQAINVIKIVEGECAYQLNKHVYPIREQIQLQKSIKNLSIRR